MNSLAGSRVVLWAAQQCDLNGLEGILGCEGCHVHVVGSLEELRAVTEGHDVDVILARVCPCIERPLQEMLRWVRSISSPPPVLIVADSLDVDLYLEAMQRGAFDCVGLPLNKDELIRIMTHALEARCLQVSAGGGRK